MVQPGRPREPTPFGRAEERHDGAGGVDGRHHVPAVAGVDLVDDDRTLSRDVVHVHAFEEGDVHDEVHAVAMGAHAGQHLDVLGDAHHVSTRKASALFCVNVNGHVAEGNVRRVLTSLS